MDIAYKTQEVRHGLKPGFEWGIVSSFKHYSSKKIEINWTESAEEQWEHHRPRKLDLWWNNLSNGLVNLKKN